MFLFDRKKRGTLRGSDLGWDRVVFAENGFALGVILDRAEQAWLAACWHACIAADRPWTPPEGAPLQ